MSVREEGKKEKKRRSKIKSWKSPSSKDDSQQTDNLLKIDNNGERKPQNRLTLTVSTSSQRKLSADQFQKKREKSTIILVLIVVIFIVCHSYRLALKGNFYCQFPEASEGVEKAFSIMKALLQMETLSGRLGAGVKNKIAVKEIENWISHSR